MAKGRVLHDRYFRQAKREGYVARSAYKLLELNQRKSLVQQGDHTLDLGCSPGSWLQVLAELVGPGGTVTGIDLKPISPQLKGELPARVVTIVGDFMLVAPDTLLAARHRQHTGRPGPDPSPPPTGAEQGHRPLPQASEELATQEIDDPHTNSCGPSDPAANKSPQVPTQTRARLPNDTLPHSPFDVVLSDMAPNTSGHGDHFLSARLCHAILDRVIDPPSILRFGGRLVMKILEGESFPEVLERVRSMFDSAGAIKPKACRDQSTETYIWAVGFRPARATPHDHGKRPGPPPPIAGWGDT